MGQCMSKGQGHVCDFCLTEIDEKQNHMDAHRLSIKIEGSPNYLILEESIPFVIPLKSGKVINVINANTIEIVTPMKINDEPTAIYKFTIKLKNLDIPRENDEEDLEMAWRKKLKKLILDKPIIINEYIHGDKGIIIADVQIDHQQFGLVNITEWMIEHNIKLGEPEKKKKPSKSLEEIIDQLQGHPNIKRVVNKIRSCTF